MAENENGQAVLTEAQKVEAVETQVGGGLWGEPVKTEPAKVETAPITEVKPIVTTEQEAVVVDENVVIKERLGFENWDEAKSAIEELKKLRESANTPAEIKFANEESRKFLSYFTEEGKEEELLTHLEKKKLIKKAESTNIENPKEAAELLKTYYKFKYKDFDSNEITDHFNDQYSKPAKPKLAVDQDANDDDYKIQVEEWQAKCEAIDKRIIRDAKMAKPDFAQFKSQVVLPDISKPTAIPQQRSQEELDTEKRITEAFNQNFPKILESLNEISVKVEDKDVTIPISYVISKEEKDQVTAVLKQFAEKGLNANVILADRWVNEDSTINVSRMTLDLLRIFNGDKMEQKFANEGASKRLFEYTKEKKNIHLPGANGSSNGSLDPAKALEAVEAAIWEGKR